MKDDPKLFDHNKNDILRSIHQSLVDSKIVQINALHPNLKLTIDVEQDSTLAFLDFCIEYMNNKFIIKLLL